MPTTRRLLVLLILVSSGQLGCGMRSVLDTDVDGEPAVTEEPDAESGAAGTKASVGAPCGHGGTCDPDNLGGETCALLGAGSGQLSCDPVTCIFDLSLCTGTVGTGNGNGNGQGGTGGGTTNPGGGTGNGNNGQGGTGGGTTNPGLFGGGATAGTGFFGGGGTAGTGFFGGGGTAGRGFFGGGGTAGTGFFGGGNTRGGAAGSGN